MSENSPSGLNGNSTLAEIEFAYDDNASYQEDGSIPECRAFLTACRMLQRRYAAEGQKGASGNRMRLDENLRRLNDAEQRAMRYLDTSQASGNVPVFPDFNDFRDY